MKLATTSLRDQLTQSYIRTMSTACDNMGGINLAQGLCDLPTPRAVIEAAERAMENDLNYYSRRDGIPILREAIAKKMSVYNGIRADPESEIVVSSGTTGAMFSSLLALLRPGDGVVLFEPYYGYHLNTLLALGLEPSYVKTNPPDWGFQVSDLEKAVTPKTKAIIVNTPSNPSGKVFTKDELKQIAEVCERHDLTVFTDEIYEYFVYEGKKHLSPATIPELRDRTITVSGFSKTFSVTGWRIGYCVCNAEQVQLIGPVSDLLYVCAPTPLQYGVAEGLMKLPASFYENIRREHEEKRRLMCDTLNEIGMKPFVPKGAYYVLANSSNLEGKDSKEKAMNLLRKTGVAAVPGKAFYADASGENLLRFCYAKKQPELEEACERLRKLV